MDVIVNARFLTQFITGTQRFAIELSKELKKIIPSIQFVAPSNIIHKELAEELGVHVIGRFKQGHLWEQIDLPLYLKKNGNPILVNLCNVAPLLYKQNIVTILDLSFHIHPEWFSKSFRALYNTLIPYCAKRSKKVITISENSRNDINKYFNIPLNHIDIIYPSISSIFIKNNVLNKEVQSGENYILAVSSIDPRKNFKGLVEAFKMANLDDTRLVIVGQQHSTFADNGLSELVAGDDRIQFTGRIGDDELASLYRHATLFAYPSFFEGFGIPPLEAMASGCPTLVSNTTSLPEVCGAASIYVDPYNLESIRDGLLKGVRDEQLRLALRQEGYKQVQKFSWQASARKMADIIVGLTT